MCSISSAAPSSSMPSGNAAGDHLRGLHAEDGTQALAAGKNAVPHGLMDGRGILRSGGKQALERLVGEDATLFQSSLSMEKKV